MLSPVSLLRMPPTRPGTLINDEMRRCWQPRRGFMLSSMARNTANSDGPKQRPKIIYDDTPPKERHGPFYREIIPPLSKVLVYSAVTYTVLYGTWRLLDYQAEASDTSSTA